MTSGDARPPETGPGPWHRPVSPVFFLLLVIAGLQLGTLLYVIAPLVLHSLFG